MATTQQTTIGDRIEVSGIGLHKGGTVHMALNPAPAGHGVVFCRSDLGVQTDEETLVPARYDAVSNTMLGTTISNIAGHSVATVEHLLAALAGAGVDNLLIEVDTDEVPAMDGSAAPYLSAIEAAGVVELDAPRKAIKVRDTIVVEDGLKLAELTPANGFSVDVAIDFDNEVIRQQDVKLDMVNGAFKSELARARTFGFLKDVEMMKQLGLGLGGSLDNAIVIDGDKVLNEDGLRFHDEFVRHKALDAVGDLFLAGAPILGAYRGVRTGHEMNNRVLRALFDKPDAYEMVTLTAEDAAGLPGGL